MGDGMESDGVNIREAESNMGVENDEGVESDKGAREMKAWRT